MVVSPYLSAIQSLKGATRGEKYKDIHSIAANIMKNDDELGKLLETGGSSHVHEALHPFLRTLVGLKLKSKDTVIEALQSDDLTIIKMAQKAQWFFHDKSNDRISIDYFLENILPFVSTRTRTQLIKVLSKCLPPKQAEVFHREFTKQLGKVQSLPLLIACGADYIYDEILNGGLAVPNRILGKLYRKHPEIIVRYLRAIVQDMTNSPKVYKHLEYNENNIKAFLPILLKNHTLEFIELIKELCRYNKSYKLVGKRAEYFVIKAADVLVSKPNVYLSWLPVKTVKRKLSQQQYDSMLRNILLDNNNSTISLTMIRNIKTYYPKIGGFQLFLQHYRDIYRKDLLDNICFDHWLDHVTFFELVPMEIRDTVGRKYVMRDYGNANYWRNVHLLPPKESIPVLKEQIGTAAYLTRSESLQNMLKSCHLYDNKDELLNVLQYYYSRHKNEQALLYFEWFSCLSKLFDNMRSLDKEHWQVIKQIVLVADVKDYFSTISPSDMFYPMLNFFLKLCNDGQADEEDGMFLDKIVEIVLEYHCEQLGGFRLEELAKNITEDCLAKFLLAVPQKYPKDHNIWKKSKFKSQLVSFFIEQMAKLNNANQRLRTASAGETTKYLIQDHPWLDAFVKEFLAEQENDEPVKKTKKKKKRRYSYYRGCRKETQCPTMSELYKKSLRRHFPDYYQSVIDENPNLINDVTTNDALMLLKRDPGKITSKIDKYVEECRKYLIKGRKSRSFVMSLKWYQDLPITFVQKCSTDIQELGNILILGILLEGKVISEIVEPLLPTETDITIYAVNAKKEYKLIASIPRALNLSNPPPTLQLVSRLCKGDFVSLAMHSLRSIAQRLPVNRVVSFAEDLTCNAISIKKVGIRLVFQVAMKPQLHHFLTNVCKNEKNHGIRQVLGKMVFQFFTRDPSKDSWDVMKLFIRSLLAEDLSIFDSMAALYSVSPDYKGDFLYEIFTKINSLGEKDIDKSKKDELFVSFLYQINDGEVLNRLPEQMINDTFLNYYDKLSLRFIINLYLFSNAEKFESRLKYIVDKYSKTLIAINNMTGIYCVDQFPLIIQFASDTLFECLLDNGNEEMTKRFIESVMDNSLIKKHLMTFIHFNIYKIYFSTSDAESFGQQCGQNIDDLIEMYKSNHIIEYYKMSFKSIIDNSVTHFTNITKFDVIDGLMNHNFNYGVFIGLQVLPRPTGFNRDSCIRDKFNNFLQRAKETDDIFIHALINDSLSNVLTRRYCS